MDSSEAYDNLEPHKKTKNKKRKGKYFSKNSFLIAFIIILSVSNIALLVMYKNISIKCGDFSSKIKNVNSNSNELEKNKSELENENLVLKQQYQSLSSQNNDILKQLDEIKKENDQIEQKNKELAQDNIELQNSLKKAASVGIKPQNYTQFNGLTSRGDIERGTYVGNFLGTAYTPSKEECGNNKGITDSGQPIIAGVSIAVDNDYWPFGTIFYIRGLGYAVAMDTGGAIKGRNRFDFAVFDKGFAKTLGSKNWEVYLVKMGTGYVDNGSLK